MIILEKGERADQLWGMNTEIITDEMIEALEQGKRLYLTVNDEYAVVIKKDGKRKAGKPEAIDTDTISRQEAINLIERYCDNGCEIAEDKWCPDCQQSQFAKMIKALPPLPSRPQWIPCSERLPEQPNPNPELEGKPLDIYLVCKQDNIPFRAFWNGRNFTDGCTTLDVDAWMPLPEPYRL